MPLLDHVYYTSTLAKGQWGTFEELFTLRSTIIDWLGCKIRMLQVLKLNWTQTCACIRWQNFKRNSLPPSLTLSLTHKKVTTRDRDVSICIPTVSRFHDLQTNASPSKGNTMTVAVVTMKKITVTEIKGVCLYGYIAHTASIAITSNAEF